MIEVTYSEKDLDNLKIRLKNFYQSLQDAAPGDAPILYKKFSPIFDDILENTTGFLYYNEGTEADINIGLSSKNKNEQNRMWSKAIDKMGMDIEEFYRGIFKETILD